MRGEGGPRTGGPGGFGGGGPRGGRTERVSNRTVYILPAKPEGSDSGEQKPVPVQVKVGISDGVNTEVIEGLEPGALVVTGTLVPAAGSANAPAANPFGGGPRFGRF